MELLIFSLSQLIEIKKTLISSYYIETYFFLYAVIIGMSAFLYFKKEKSERSIKIAVFIIMSFFLLRFFLFSFPYSLSNRFLTFFFLDLFYGTTLFFYTWIRLEFFYDNKLPYINFLFFFPLVFLLNITFPLSGIFLLIYLKNIWEINLPSPLLLFFSYLKRIFPKRKG